MVALGGQVSNNDQDCGPQGVNDNAGCSAQARVEIPDNDYFAIAHALARLPEKLQRLHNHLCPSGPHRESEQEAFVTA
jgi:hypothetical protein